MTPVSQPSSVPPARAWRARLIALREAECEALAELLVELDNVGQALSHDEPLCAELRKVAALIRARRNDRASEARALETYPEPVYAGQAE
jgi:hypothetical protein